VVFDEARGGLVIEGLTLRSRETGVHELTFYVQRDNGDDILPGYDECLWETNNER
jgi:hypothetical protein